MNKKYLYIAFGLMVIALVVSIARNRDRDGVDVVIVPTPGTTSTTTKPVAPKPTPAPVPVAATGTISGKVTLSPVCPVERMPPDPNCAPRGYQTDIQVLDASGLKILKTIRSAADGSFKVVLVEGKYQIKPLGGNPYPRCSQQSVTVAAAKTVTVDLSCDTGIR